MDATTRERAKEKAEAVSHKIGYPKELQTSEELNTHYLRLEEIGTTTYFHNMLAARKYGARRNIEKLNHPTAGSVTASFGVTQFKENDTPNTLFKRCDNALYKAKESGRNRVCLG